jgi:excisionase family DNA binding protein
VPRYRIRLTRIQTAERSVRASTEEEALEKIEAEAQRPYGFIGGWQTTTTDAEVVAVEPVDGVTARAPDGGPLLFSVKDAAAYLGLSRNQLYELLNAGELDHVRLGRRMYVSRDAMVKFIEGNTKSGYHPHR